MSQYVAIGTTGGLVAVFTLAEKLHKILGTDMQAKQLGAVTALDMDQKGEWLVAGHESGRIVVWDLITGNCIKVLVSYHTTPITHVKFLHQKTRVVASSTEVTMQVIAYVNKWHYRV